MIQDVWIQGAVLSLALAQLFVFWFLYRRASASSATDGGQATGTGGHDGEQGGEIVVCPGCGAENDSGFRYCRRCTDELPDGLDAVPGGASPQSRGMF